MSKLNVEPTQPELLPQQYSSQYIQLSTHPHLVPALKMERVTPSLSLSLHGTVHH